MLIDPFTVGVQIVNFLILVWLLRRLLYGPITRAMTARESRIQAELDEARRLREEATAEGERHRQQVAEFEAGRDARLAEARAELEAWRHSHTQAVRTEVETMRERWQQALQQEKEAFLADLRHRVGREVLAAARRALRDLADSDLEALIVARFLERLRRMANEDRDRLIAAARQDERRVRVRTAYALPEAEQARIGQAIDETFGTGIAVHFDTTPDLLAGVELSAGGLKVAWSLADYVTSIEDALREVFGSQPETDHAPRH